ncbi:hypothetical protein, partial [Xylanibacter rodentium]
DEHTIDERTINGNRGVLKGQRAHSPGQSVAAPRAMCSLPRWGASIQSAFIYGVFIYGVFIYGRVLPKHVAFIYGAFCPNMSRSSDVRTIM